MLDRNIRRRSEFTEPILEVEIANVISICVDDDRNLQESERFASFYSPRVVEFWGRPKLTVRPAEDLHVFEGTLGRRA